MWTVFSMAFHSSKGTFGCNHKSPAKIGEPRSAPVLGKLPLVAIEVTITVTRE
jgi:hypothetical protein